MDILGVLLAMYCIAHVERILNLSHKMEIPLYVIMKDKAESNYLGV